MAIATIILSEQFISDLNTVYASLVPRPAQRSEPEATDFRTPLNDFFRDLEAVHRTVVVEPSPIQAIPDLTLVELERSFTEIRCSVRARLGGATWLEQVPQSDPLRNRIGLFGTLDFGLHETAHTRALAWLLDPHREHGFGDALLLQFVQQVFPEQSVRQLFSPTVNVESEALSETRQDRLDIRLRGQWTLPNGTAESWEIIVEAKIAAEEGLAQCARYEKHESRSSHRRFVFLTPDGAKPTTATSNQEWTPVSFIELMAGFRQRLPKLSDKPGFDFLRLYMTGVLKDLYEIRCGEGQEVVEQGDIYRVSEYLFPPKPRGNHHD